ncbi:MAG: ABC transporter permease subunit, partial [Gammaproteobacteria bacterium]
MPPREGVAPRAEGEATPGEGGVPLQEGVAAGRRRLRDLLLTLLALAALGAALHWLGRHGSFKLQEACALFAIWAIAAVSLNLINGVTGILSLGQHGFMLIGGYATALLILPEAAREVMATSARSQMTPFTLSLSLPRAFDALGLH